MPSEAKHLSGDIGSPRFPSADGATSPAESLLEALLAEQRQDWMAGKRIFASERLQQYPALAADPVQGAELVFHEFTLRQELGEFPDWQEYLRQFPQYAPALRLLGEADRMVEQALPTAEAEKRSLPQLDGYELLAEIGRGGMGIVYKARQKRLDRVVAVKMLRAGADADADQRKRFRREAEAVAHLQHPNIVPIYEVGETRGQPFLALEFVDGPSLAKLINGTPLPAQQAACLVEILARAMQYAHGQGIIHRDLKPSNVLLAGMPETGREGGVPKITDFGLAKRLDKMGDTASGQVLGTPGYMAPEQAEPGTAPIDQRTDVYGLGVILYELLTGRRPFLADSALQTVKQVLEAEPARPRLVNPAVPADVETICLKCLEKEPGRRSAMAQALADDLQRFQVGEPIKARPVGAVERGWRWCRRKPMIAGLAAALLLAVAGGFSTSMALWVRAGANWRRETVARQEAEENFARLRALVVLQTHRSAAPAVWIKELNPLRESMLHDAESYLSFLLENRNKDPALPALLADVLTQLGEIRVEQQRHTEAVHYLERAVALWNQLPSETATSCENRMGRAITYFCLERAYEKQGLPDRAQQSFTVAFELWRGLEIQIPSPSSATDIPFGFLLGLIQALIPDDHSEKAVSVRFAEIRSRLDRMQAGPDGGLFLDFLRVKYLCLRMETLQLFQRWADILIPAREAASLLAGLLMRTSLTSNTHWHVIHCCIEVSRFLRMAQAPEEALRLSQQTTRAVQALLQDAPDTDYLLTMMDRSWHELSKIHWELDQTEETLTALRNGLGALRRLFVLHPEMPRVRQALGDRYASLGRKLCELGRLDEAESYFDERLALWPGDAAKHAETLQDLRQWAAKVGEDPKHLSPEEQQERQRYLDLCARLEGKKPMPAPEGPRKPGTHHVPFL
jgi:tetratricopeptide (TPR) repeat protein